MINIEDAKDAEKLATYLSSRFSEATSADETQKAPILAAYLSRNSKKGSINKDDISDPNKLCNFINRVTR